VGKVPDEIVRVFVEFLDICYLIRRQDFDEDVLRVLDQRIGDFFDDVKIFKTFQVRKHFNLPRQHALRHYITAIEDFGSPVGSDTSMTENAHIRAVKRPWRRSNRKKAILQVLLTNTRLERLAAVRRKLEKVGELRPSYASSQPPAFGEGEAYDGPVPEERGFGTVKIANTPRKCLVNHGSFLS
jgi:hypothetical protein